MPGTLNMWSGVQNLGGGPVLAPNYVDLLQGYTYCIMVANTTDEPITSGTIAFAGADALPDNPCLPGEFGPLDPVADCGPITSGVPYDGPVSVTLSEERPIPARGTCQFAFPCPKQFLQVTSVPAGTEVWCLIGNLRRSDWSHTTPLGFIPPPLQAPFTLGFQAPAALAAPAHGMQHQATHAAPPRQRRAPQPQPQPRHPAE